MKTTYRNSVILLSLLFAGQAFSATTVLPVFRSIHIVFSSKAYWDGPSKSCIPREKGGCCHIWAEGMVPGPGEITGEMSLAGDKIIQLTVSRGKGMNNETYMKYFSDGRFNLDGPITFDPVVLSRLGIEGSYVVPPGSYPYVVNGAMVTITFK